MKVGNIIKYTIALVSISGIIACKKDLGFKEPSGDDSSVPGSISNIKVENLPGKAKIIYNVPNDKNLLYVIAQYTLPSGITADAKASLYKDTLVLEGFADTLEHEVKVYSVSRNEVYSEPTIVKVKPKEAAFWSVFKSISINNAFGGYNLKAVNSARDNISIIVMKKNVFNEFEVDNFKSVFTKTDSILSKIRGLDTIDYQFGIYVKDKWGNKSDTSFTNVRPFFEQELPVKNFKVFSLPGDTQLWPGTNIAYAWDGRYGWPWTIFTQQIEGGPNPHIITFDTGVKAKVSRVWIRPYPEGNKWYYLTTMKRFEIYGSVNPSLNGALDNSWFLLGTYELKKPSKLPYGNDSADDQAIAAAGFSWDVNINAPEARYIRVKCLENFAGGTAMSINEIKVFGAPSK